MAERMGGDSKYGRLFTVDDVCAVVFAVLVHHGIEPTLAKVDTEGAMRMMDEAPEGDPVRPTFPADEPLFLLRGQDAFALGAVGDYARRCRDGAKVGGGLAVRRPGLAHLKALNAGWEAIEKWQAANPERVKVPD